MAGMPLRTVTIGQGWPDDRPGGLNRYVADLHTALPSAGVSDELVVFGPAGGADAQTVRACSEGSALPTRLLSTAAAARWAGRDAQLLATHFALYGLLPRSVAPLRTLPHVAHFHGPWGDESVAQGASGLAPRMKARFERHHLRSADAVITASRAFADLVVGLHGLDSRRVHAVHPGVDADRFSPLSAPDRDEVRRRLGVAPGQHLVVTARRLVPRMGLEGLVGAWSGEDGARLVIIGDGPLRPELERRATAGSKGVSLTGRVSDDDLVAWYRAADLVVVPSVELEGFGLVVLEALACGTPVIASDVGGLSEVLSEMGPELLLPPGDAAAWRARTAASAAPGLPDRDECRRVAERHTAGHFASAVADVYRAYAA